MFIYIIRHGESEGNVDSYVYANKPDHTIELTQTGYRQACQLGKEFQTALKEAIPHIFYSPYWRVRQTVDAFINASKCKNPVLLERSELREQQWDTCGPITPEDVPLRNELCSKAYGDYYINAVGIEPSASVELRARTFVLELKDYIRHMDKESYNSSVIFIFTHQMMMRMLVKVLLNLSIEEFEGLPLYKNCAVERFIYYPGNDEIDILIPIEIVPSPNPQRYPGIQHFLG